MSARIFASDLVLVLIPRDFGTPRSRYFSRRPTQKSRKRNSRSVEPMIPNDFEVLFGVFTKSRIHLYVKRKGFRPLIALARKCMDSHGLLAIPGIHGSDLQPARISASDLVLVLVFLRIFASDLVLVPVGRRQGPSKNVEFSWFLKQNRKCEIQCEKHLLSQ